MDKELAKAREEIRGLDQNMAELFLRRMDAVKKIAACKKTQGLPVRDENYEEAAVKRNAEAIADPQQRACYEQFLRETMAVSRQYQHWLLEDMQVAYSGIEGAFAHIAAKHIFPDAQLSSFPSFEQAYDAVSSGACDCAVLPVENSYTGEVGQVTDLMFRGSLYVNGVYDLHISQNLLGCAGADPAGITTVISHPQALQQCQPYIRRRGLREINAVNTAIAAQTVAEKRDPHTAAIASMETARLYGLQVLDHDINESRNNTTRFAVFSKVESEAATAGEKTTYLMLFTVNNVAGALAKAINAIGEHGFNMKVLRSRPMKTLPWQYYFYVEAEGDESGENGKRMLAALGSQCAMLKAVGRYPAANVIKGGDVL